MTEASTGPHHFDMAGWLSPAPFESLLNLEVVEAGQGKATLAMPFLLQFAQGAGLMHGGALVSLADSAMVMAIKTLLPPGSHFATIHLETDFLHPVKKGVVTAKAEVLSREERIIKGRSTLYDDEGRVVMEFRSTFKIARDTRIEGIRYLDAASPGEGEESGKQR
jgi:acyl-CoA thioesterase